MTRHFLQLSDFSAEELKTCLARASALKKSLSDYKPLSGKVLGMIFEKSSTRTRVSFEAGMAQLGGTAIFLSPKDLQLGRGETLEDTARVLSRLVDAIVIRTFEHNKIERFSAHSRVPVINGLTDLHHPCQLLADMQTYQEHKGDIQGKTVVYVGDGNNMCHSYMQAAELFDFSLRIACPEGYEPKAEILAHCSHCQVVHDPQAAAIDADLIVTDVWASMGQEAEAEQRLADFAPFQVNANLLAQAKADAVFLHCLPAHRGEEVSAEVLDGAQSLVWDAAENRLHSQKALLEFLLVR
jgi:ornithine carbamoyltransferase